MCACGPNEWPIEVIQLLSHNEDGHDSTSRRHDVASEVRDAAIVGDDSAISSPAELPTTPGSGRTGSGAISWKETHQHLWGVLRFASASRSCSERQSF